MTLRCRDTGCDVVGLPEDLFCQSCGKALRHVEPVPRRVHFDPASSQAREITLRNLSATGVAVMVGLSAGGRRWLALEPPAASPDEWTLRYCRVETGLPVRPDDEDGPDREVLLPPNADVKFTLLRKGVAATGELKGTLLVRPVDSALVVSGLSDCHVTLGKAPDPSCEFLPGSRVVVEPGKPGATVRVTAGTVSTVQLRVPNRGGSLACLDSVRASVDWIRMVATLGFPVEGPAGSGQVKLEVDARELDPGTVTATVFVRFLETGSQETPLELRVEVAEVPGLWLEPAGQVFLPDKRRLPPELKALSSGVAAGSLLDIPIELRNLSASPIGVGLHQVLPNEEPGRLPLPADQVQLMVLEGVTPAPIRHVWRLGPRERRPLVMRLDTTGLAPGRRYGALLRMFPEDRPDDEEVLRVYLEVGSPRRLETLGIDFGTTSTCACAWDGELQEPRLLVLNAEEVVAAGRPPVVEIPTAAYFPPAGRVMLGETVTRQLAEIEPARTVRSLKRYLFANADPPPLQGSADIVELVGRVFEELGRRVAAAECATPSHVVLTVPATFEEVERRRVQEAARHAGLASGEVELLPEPVAAGIGFVLGHHDMFAAQPRHVLVFDCGGGTTDVAVLKCHVNGDRLEIAVRAVVGTRLAGDQMDLALMGFYCGQVQGQLPPGRAQALHGFPEANMAHHERVNRYRLWQAAEDVKKALSVASLPAKASFPELALRDGDEAGGQDLRLPPVEVGRQQFAGAIATLLEEGRQAVRKACGRAGIGPDQLHLVLMTGNASRVPEVRQAIEALAPAARPVTEKDHPPKHSVALGATHYLWQVRGLGGGQHLRIRGVDDYLAWRVGVPVPAGGGRLRFHTLHGPNPDPFQPEAEPAPSSAQVVLQSPGREVILWRHYHLTDDRLPGAFGATTGGELPDCEAIVRVSLPDAVPGEGLLRLDLDGTTRKPKVFWNGQPCRLEPAGKQREVTL